MNDRSARIKHKGQVTLPAELRKELGWEEGDRVILRREGKRVVLERPEDVVAELYGVLAAYANPANASRDIYDIVEEEDEWLANAVSEEQIETLARIGSNAQDPDQAVQE